jgi:lysophospholipase L1-like esterase
MDRIKKLLVSEKPAKWLFYGDSITHGALHTFGGRDYVELFSERVRFELGRTLDVVINTAISGDTTRDLLETFDWRVAQFRPQAVFVMIGGNDCNQQNGIDVEKFTANLRTLAERIRSIAALPVLQTTCPPLPGLAPERAPHFESYMDAIRAVAAEEDAPLIDHTRFWREYPDNHFFWMSNAFHPNIYGHRAFAMCLFQALGIVEKDSPTVRLFLP